MNKFEYLVYIGRFQPLHSGHVEVIKKALGMSDKVIIVIGSVNEPRTAKNPFTFEERKKMFVNCPELKEYKDRLIIKSCVNFYNATEWCFCIRSIVEDITKDCKKIGIIGYKKDNTSYYLMMFPKWKEVKTDYFNQIDATDLRRVLFEGIDLNNYEDIVPSNVIKFLKNFRKFEDFGRLKEEYNYLITYKKSWERAPYPPVFVTVDSVVVHNEQHKVLMIRRKGCPGKGYLALPGGFVEQDELLINAAFRELREETKLQVTDSLLEKSFIGVKVFDYPHRSQRGRLITHAHYFNIMTEKLPSVKGGDDAKEALWVSLNDLDSIRDQIFEDHLYVIRHFYHLRRKV